MSADAPENSGSAPDTAGLALELAMEEARANPALQERVGAFLDDQRSLIELQKHHLQQQFKPQLRQLYLGIWEKRLGVLLRLATAFVGLGVASALGAMVWSAAHDDGLVIESFSVPPDLTGRGLTGQVVATQMLDNLTTLQSRVGSVRAPGSYANNWGDDITVEIPQTGISIGQLNTWLRQWLGNRTYITGEVVRTATGIAVTARAGARAGQRFFGAETEFDALLLQATNAVYADTQPYRYAISLMGQGRTAEALSFLENAARREAPSEQVWAHSGMFNILQSQHRVAESAAAAQAAVKLNPEFAWGWTKVAAGTASQGRLEASLAAERNVLRLLAADPAASGLRTEALETVPRIAAMNVSNLLGDHAEFARLTMLRAPALSDADAARYIPEALAAPGGNINSALDAPLGYGSSLIAMHDLAAARRITAGAPALRAAITLATANRVDAQVLVNGASAAHVIDALELQLAVAGHDWVRAIEEAGALYAREPVLNAASLSLRDLYPPANLWPLRAIAEAQLGNFSAAHRWIDRTPGDCDLCLRTRGQIAELEKRHGAADFWFARAVATAPSIPFAYENWGRALLERGQPDAAIVQFTLANQKGPNFADPLEGWGEALMAKNQSHLALAKFAAAEKFAPNWGRLHLKWGQALAYTGKPDEAKAKFARAATFDLTPAEKVELAKVRP